MASAGQASADARKRFSKTRDTIFDISLDMRRDDEIIFAQVSPHGETAAGADHDYLRTILF